MPNVLLPVPGPPLIRINFGGSFTFLKGGGELNARRCFMEAGNEVDAAIDFFGVGLNADAERRMQHATRRQTVDKRVIILRTTNNF